MAKKQIIGKKVVPFEFVLEALEDLEYRTHPMFGALAVYVGDKIVMILRDRESSPQDNGLWLTTTIDHHESLRRDFPGLRSIAIFDQAGPTGWQVIAADREDFEEKALLACELIRQKDPRIGKLPSAKRRKSTSALGKAKTRVSKVQKSSAKMDHPSAPGAGKTKKAAFEAAGKNHFQAAKSRKPSAKKKAKSTRRSAKTSKKAARRDR